VGGPPDQRTEFHHRDEPAQVVNLKKNAMLYYANRQKKKCQLVWQQNSYKKNTYGNHYCKKNLIWFPKT
jgi:hypothetical protein